MSLKAQIDADIKKAMLAKQKDDLRALRAIKSMILLAETEKGGGDDLSEATEMQLLTKAAKQRKDSADLFKKEGRDDLYEKEMQELEVINRYLPQQLSEDELRVEVQKIIDQTGASGPQEIGKVMGVASKALAGKADNKMVSQVARELLSK